ncbi:hypothetical protein D3C87_1106720 [compost metagenome]
MRAGVALQRLLELAGILAGDVQRRAEGHGLLHAGLALQLDGERGEVVALHAPRGQVLAGHHLRRRALRQQPAIGDIGELVAALGLIHIVRADQHRDAVRGQLVKLLPEVAPGLGIDPGGGFVEQQQLGLVQQARRQRQPLLPSAGQRAGQLRGARLQAEVFQRAVHGLAAVGHGVDAGHELEVLADRQVFPVGKALCHIADVALDLGGLLQDVEAQAGARARVRRQQPAHHADGGGLAAAVGAEEAEDLAARHLHGQVVDHVLVAEALVQPLDVDRQRAVGAIHGVVHDCATSTGWPGRSLGASSGVGRASIRKTSLRRVSLL